MAIPILPLAARTGVVPFWWWWRGPVGHDLVVCPRVGTLAAHGHVAGDLGQSRDMVSLGLAFMVSGLVSTASGLCDTSRWSSISS